MESLEQIKARLEQAIPGAQIELVSNGSAAAQHSLLVNAPMAREIGRFLRDEPSLQFDYLSNVTGVDWLDRQVQEKVRTKRIIDGQEREIEETIERNVPGYLEVVYHLYSMVLKHGPLILRLRTASREPGASLPSLTPIWRSAEFQEREIFDLFGVHFDGHPDLRRILMWDGFLDHPMRKDYREPDDFEYEPTAHDEVLERAREHRAK